ncbi:MAG: GGDEF domain-containing protein [Lachnospiraceae bacterium]|nr:GGDEF domain-containing protein [Lachnospiraceae bacterium]
MDINSRIKDVVSHGELSEKYKYSLIISLIMTVHVILIALFCYFQILPLILLNIGSVILYILCLVMVRRDKSLLFVFCATYLEIIVQSFVSTLCIGWHFGFPQYIIALVPFGYYMCHTLIGNRRRYVIATVLGLIAFASFIGSRMLSMYFDAIYQLEVSTGGELGIYIFNSICNFGFLFMVTAIYIIEMQTAQNKLRSQNAVLDQLANIDPLTGLYNRRSMQAFFNQAIEAGSPFCLVMCDIDDFKQINDTHGHDIGDMVLREITRLIREQVEHHGQACRWGGEELLLLLQCDREEACRIAESIRREICEFRFPVGEQSIQCSITIVVARHREGDAIDHTITRADNNLYYGKCNGKNQVVSEKNMEILQKKY